MVRPLVLALWVVLVGSAFSTAAQGAIADAPVTIAQSGDSVVLSNGVIAATISKSGASVKRLKFKGFDMLKDGYYSMDGGANYRRPAGCKFEVKVSSPALADIAMTRTWKDEPQAFDIEIHYLLRQGDSGLYTYAILRHPAAYPATGYGEWRMVWKLDDDLLETICVDALRHWKMQRSTDTFETTPIKEIIKVTSGVRAGQYDCKYDYSASYYDLGCWGHASDVNKVGAFMVMGSQEFLNDGPTKQDLNAAAGINHIHFGMNHYNGSGLRVAAGQEWKKIYGPFLMYCASGDTASICWDDAKRRVLTDRAAWPYPWIHDPEYPMASLRGGVSGTLKVSDPLKPAITGRDAWVGLAQVSKGGNWQFESTNYQYWARADSTGKFKIPNVRPGAYTLYAFTVGVVGEFSRSVINVSAGATTPLGTLAWRVPRHGSKIAWEIGLPDRTAREFRGGNDYFHGYLWEAYDKAFPNPLVYTVGTSKPGTDWNYAQARYGREGPPHQFRIHFNLDEAPKGAATLTLAIASADGAAIYVFVNDPNTPLATVTPSVQGGNALLREGIHAKYCVETVAISAGELKAGKNSITLSLASVRKASAHVMYDYLSLELP